MLFRRIRAAIIAADVTIAHLWRVPLQLTLMQCASESAPQHDDACSVYLVRSHLVILKHFIPPRLPLLPAAATPIHVSPTPSSRPSPHQLHVVLPTYTLSCF